MGSGAPTDASLFAPAALSLLVAACGLPRAVEPDVRGEVVVVAQALLSTESSTQTIWIERSSSIDSTLGGRLRPLIVAPSLVEVRDTLGGQFVFAQDLTNPARFVASFTPINGRRYDLRIDVDTQTLTASVTVPLPLTLVQPVSDTVVLAAGDSLTAVWTSGSSRHFGWAVTPTDTSLWDRPTFLFDALTRDSTLSIPSFEFQGTRLFWALAFDATSWAYFHPRESPDRLPVAGNVRGGAGILGAVTADRVVVQGP